MSKENETRMKSKKSTKLINKNMTKSHMQNQQKGTKNLPQNAQKSEKIQEYISKKSLK